VESKTPVFSGVWRGRLFVRLVAGAAVVVSAFVPGVRAAEALFPRPLHIVRRVEDPIAKTVTTFEQYCAGDEVVTVNGARVVIADYARQQLTEIDRGAGTYSITPFDALAKAQPAATQQKSAAAWTATPRGTIGTRNGRSLDSFELSRDGADKLTLDIGVDRNTRLSRAALEVLIGAAYPNPRREEHDAILRVATNGDPAHRAKSANGIAAQDDYALPFETSITIDAAGSRVTMRNSVLDVRSELAPEELKLIPPGARKVESPAVRVARELRELDQLPSRIQPESH